MADKLLLIDAFSLVHQAFHAVGALTTRDGLPTNAVFGLTSMLLRLLEDERPAAMALAFDTPEPTFRHQEFPEYKSHRPPMDESLVVQLPLVQDLVAAFRWPAIRVPGYEADDILATLAVTAAPAWDVYIVSADRDLCQVVRDHVTLLATQGRGIGDVKRFDRAAVIEKFGVPPELVPDWKGLVGDTSDNIPGVRGIGEKTATELLTTFGDLEGILAATDQLKGKRRETLEASVDIARQCKHLATVRYDVPLPVTVDDLRRKDLDDEAVAALFHRLEFHQLQRRLSPRNTTPPPATLYETVTDDAGALRVAEAVAAARVVGLAWREDLPGVAVSTAAARGWFLPLAKPRALSQMALFHDTAEDDRDRLRLSAALRPLATGQAAYVAHDVQKLYRGLGIDAPELQELRGDSSLAAWLLDPERLDHPIKTLAGRYLGETPDDPPTGHPDPGAFLACQAADLARRLEPRLREDLDGDHLTSLYDTLELPLAPLLGRMMAAGVMLDRPAALALDAELRELVGAKKASIRESVIDVASSDLNVDSPKQLAELLYETLHLPAGRKTKTGYSTDAATLQTIRELHPVVDLILEYRELAKLKSTYTEPLLNLADDQSRVRTSLNQTGAATGRLSSSQPNLQNIPVRGNWGERVRALFRSAPGTLLLAADYSQIELRVLAHVSADRRLIDAFRHGEDVHTLAAVEIFGVDPDAVSADQRRMAKVLNFGVAYGIQAHGLSQRLEIPRDQAQQLIDAYFERFPNVKCYAEDTILRARENGYVQTMFGRRRRLPDLLSRNPNLRQAAERAAINMPIQGAAADIIKRAMLLLEPELADTGARMILQVHDELLLEVPPAAVDAVTRQVRAAMGGAAELDVPLEVSIGVGERWSELKG